MGFKDTSVLWEVLLTRARARADAQYGDMAREVRMNMKPSGLGKRPCMGSGVRVPQPGEDGAGRGQEPHPNNQGAGAVVEKSCIVCLKMGHKAHSKDCGVTMGDPLVPLYRETPALSPDEQQWATQWRSLQSSSKLTVRDGGVQVEDKILRGEATDGPRCGGNEGAAI